MRLAEYFDELDDEKAQKPEKPAPYRAWYERSEVQSMAMRALGALADLSEATRDQNGLTWYVPLEAVANRIGCQVDDDLFETAIQFLSLEQRFSDGKGRELKRRRTVSPYIVGQSSKGVRLNQMPRLA